MHGSSVPQCPREQKPHKRISACEASLCPSAPPGTRTSWGDFVTNLSQARFNYSFTPRVNFQSLIQYNDRDENWSGNLRFAWLNAAGAGSGLFVVHNATQALEGLGPINRTFIIKYSRQLDVLR